MLQTTSNGGDSAGEALGQPLATGAGWLLLDELSTAIRRAPPWRGLHRALLPLAVVVGITTWVLAYFGVPTVWLSALTVALGVGHLWPGWSARESAAFWAPEERHLRFVVGSEGVSLETPRGARHVPFRELRSLHCGEAGWLLWPRGQALLWLPRRVFGEEQAAVVDGVLRALPVDPPWGGLRWLYVGGMILSGMATALESL